MQRKLTMAFAAVAALAICVPVATAKPGNGNGGSSDAAKLCAAQKKADKAAFKALWGKHAMRDCIRAARAGGEVATTEPEEIHNAAQACRAERDADPAGFASTYGTNDNDRNAFGKCVSSAVRAAGDGGDPAS